MRAIWYRHWLELRLNTAILCSLTLVAAFGYAFAVHGAASYLARSGRLTQEIARYEAILALSRGPQLVPWAVHTLVVGFFSLWVCGLFRGTGLDIYARTGNVWGRHMSVYFTASLPVSRSWMIATRTGAGVAAISCVLMVSLVAHVIALLVIGQPIPIVAMMRTTLLGVAGGFALITVGVSLSLVVSDWLAGIATFVITMALWLTQGGWNRTLEFVAGESLIFPVIVVSSSMLLLTISIVIARRKDL